MTVYRANLTNRQWSRRELMAKSGQCGLALASSIVVGNQRMLLADNQSIPKGKAESCIFIWLGGGACHVDMWDQKQKGDGDKKPGSYYDPVSTAIPGVFVCEHLARTAALMDRAALIRSVHHDQENHQPATNLMHTGRMPTGTTLYPAIGSVVSHERGPREAGIPPYIVMGYPNATRNPGFLGAEHGYIYLTETEAGPAGLRRPPEITLKRQKRRESMLADVRQAYLKRRQGNKQIENYGSVSEQGFCLAGTGFSKLFDLNSESASLRSSYGGEFGQRCLLARRLVHAGVRFIEVSFNLNFINGTGWDTHREGQLNQHRLIGSLDRALSTLILDLEHHRLLDSTLIVVATEFGRPPEFDGAGGRGHHPNAFSVFTAGGGLRTGQVIGETDELGRRVIQQPVSVPDLHATLYCALGIDPSEELFDGDRPVPITNQGHPIRQLFA